MDNTSGHANIFTSFEKRWNNEYWEIAIECNGERYRKNLNKTKYTIEDAIAWRDAKYIELGIEIFN